MLFDIANDALISKREFIAKCGVSRNTLNKYLQMDPDAPQPHVTPIGEMYVVSEINRWLSKYDPDLRNFDCEITKSARAVIRETNNG